MSNVRRIVTNVSPGHLGALSLSLCATHAGAQTTPAASPVIEQVIVTAQNGITLEVKL